MKVNYFRNLPFWQWYQLILLFTLDFLSSLLSSSKYHHFCLPYTQSRIPQDSVSHQGTYLIVKGGKVIKQILFLSCVHYLEAAGLTEQCNELQKIGSLQLRDSTLSE